MFSFLYYQPVIINLIGRLCSGGKPDAQLCPLSEAGLGLCFRMIEKRHVSISAIDLTRYTSVFFILASFDKKGCDYHPFIVVVFSQTSPQMCVYLFLMFLLPYHTFQFGTFDTNMLDHFAAAPKLESGKESGKERVSEKEREPVIFQLWMPAFGVSLWLIISYQSFNSGARSGRFKPWKQLALCSPTVRVSFAVDDGNIKPVSREWTSQSESLSLSCTTPSSHW